MSRTEDVQLTAAMDEHLNNDSTLVKEEPLEMDIKVEEEEILCQDYQQNINSSKIQREKTFETNKQDPKDGAKDFENISTLSTNDCDMENDDFEDEDEEHECTLCSRLFQSGKIFKAHIKEHAKLDGILSDGGGEEKSQTIKDRKTKNVDHPNISSKKTAYSHKNAEKSPYKCLDCPKKYASKKQLQLHERMHAERPFQCGQCTKLFLKKEEFENHVFKHQSIQHSQTTMERHIFKKRCFNPLENTQHLSSCGELRTISKNLREKYINVPKSAKICTTCRKSMTNLSKMSPLQLQNVSMEEKNIEEIHDQNIPGNNEVHDIFEPPSSPNLNHNCENEIHFAAVEVFDQIKEKFVNADSNSERVLLLTLAPKSWGRRRIAEEFGASERQARKAKQLVNQCGILTYPNAKKVASKEPVSSSGPSKRSRSGLSQSKFYSLSERDFEFLEYEFVPGHRHTSKLLYADEQFYNFNCTSSLGDGYLCAHDNCGVRVYIVPGDKCIRLNNSPIHAHERKTDEYKKLVCLNEMKRRCAELKYMLPSHRVTVRDVFNSVMSEHPGVSLDFFKYERTLQNIRSTTFPKNPLTCDEISKTFRNKNIMDSIGCSQHAGNAPFFNGVVQTEEYSFCVFSSKYIFDLIEKNFDVRNRCYSLDGTFKMVSVGPFKKLLIFYAIYIEKAYPFIFVLMSRKTEECYAHVFRFIEEQVFALHPSKIITDYELSMRNALQKQYPEAKFVSCWFHFTQAIKRNACKITEFINFIRSNDNAKKVYYQLMSLPLLPAEFIKPIFDHLKLKAFEIDKRKFALFMHYYERQWIEKEGSSKICVYGEDIQIMASLEAYNHKFDDIMVKNDHFYRFAVALNKLEYAKSMEMEKYIASGGLTSYKRKRKNRNAMIQEAATQLTSGAITPMDFLNRILHNDEMLSQTIIDFAHVETGGRTEIDEFDFDMENYIAAEELKANQIHNNSVVALDQLSSISQSNATVADSLEDDTSSVRGRNVNCLLD